MKIVKNLFIIFLVTLLFSCDLFLGQDADKSPEGVLYSLWKSFDERHAYIDIKMGINPNFNNWNEVYEHYNNQLTTGKTDLFHACGDMLNELADPHVVLYDSSGNAISLDASYFSYRKTSAVNEKTELIRMARDRLTGRGIVVGNNDMIYGTFISAPHIGYLYISNFTDVFNWVERIDVIVDYLKKNTDKVIIDIRYNYGGASPVVEFIASRFASVYTNFSISSVKNGPGRNDFSLPTVSVVKPSDNSYTKPIIILTNKATISAAEWFTLALRTQPHVTHVGTNTQGALSMVTMHPMINGWYYSVSAYKVTDMQGRCYEGFGVKPHVEITGEENTSWVINPDTQLMAVLDWLLKETK